jgi:outer membrane protein
MMKASRFIPALLLAIGATLLSTTLTARADGGPSDADTWLVRIRALELQPANQSAAIPAAGVPQNGITLNSKIIPEVDLSFFFADPHWATELVLTYPQKQNVYLQGNLIGTFNHLPPSLLLQYHPLPGANFQPYIGLGINETLIRGVSLHVPGVGALGLSSASTNVALQAGADFKVGARTYFNIDGKYIGLTSGVFVGAAQVSTVGINPWLYGVGYGYRF